MDCLCRLEGVGVCGWMRRGGGGGGGGGLVRPTTLLSDEASCYTVVVCIPCCL